MLYIVEFSFYLMAVLWLILTITVQFPALVKKMNFLYKYDKIYFFPKWKLFSPNPINCDYLIVYKDLISGKDEKKFETNVNEFILNYHFSIGNKGKCALFRNLSLIHASTIKNKDEKSFLEYTPEYYKIKYILSNYKREENILKRQFSCFVIRHDRKGEKGLVFTSYINYRKWI